MICAGLRSPESFTIAEVVDGSLIGIVCGVTKAPSGAVSHRISYVTTGPPELGARHVMNGAPQWPMQAPVMTGGPGGSKLGSGNPCRPRLRGTSNVERLYSR